MLQFLYGKCSTAAALRVLVLLVQSVVHASMSVRRHTGIQEYNGILRPITHHPSAFDIPGNMRQQSLLLDMHATAQPARPAYGRARRMPRPLQTAATTLKQKQKQKPQHVLSYWVLAAFRPRLLAACTCWYSQHNPQSPSSLADTCIQLVLQPLPCWPHSVRPVRYMDCVEVCSSTDAVALVGPLGLWW